MDINRLIILSRAERHAELKRVNVLEALRQAGHSVAKAADIYLGALKGERYSLSWAASAVEQAHEPC